MEKIEYFAASLMLLIVTFFIGGAIYIFLRLFSGETYNPRAEIRFDLEQYNYTLTFDDFKHYLPFSDAQCNDCELSKNSYMVAVYLYRKDGISVSMYREKGNNLSILFYGKDKEKINVTLKDFLIYLSESDRFKKGFRVCAESACTK